MSKRIGDNLTEGSFGKVRQALATEVRALLGTTMADATELQKATAQAYGALIDLAKLWDAEHGTRYEW